MKRLINIDNCHPDYFGGHHNRVLVAYYDKHTTVSEVLEEIEQDVNNQEITKEYCNFSYSDFKKALVIAYDENFEVLKKQYMPDCEYSYDESDPDYLGDDLEGCCAFFTILEEG